MLKKVKYLNWSGNFAYAPPQEDCIINTDEVISVVPTEARGSGPFMLVKMSDGSKLTLVGVPEDLL